MVGLLGGNRHHLLLDLLTLRSSRVDLAIASLMKDLWGAMSPVYYLGLDGVGPHHLLTHALLLNLAIKIFLLRETISRLRLTEIVDYLGVIILSIV